MDRIEAGNKEKKSVRPIHWKEGKRFVRYAEGAEIYSMSLTKFQELAKEAKACYKLNQMVLVNLNILDEYLENFRITDDEFYK